MLTKIAILVKMTVSRKAITVKTVTLLYIFINVFDVRFLNPPICFCIYWISMSHTMKLLDNSLHT